MMLRTHPIHRGHHRIGLWVALVLVISMLIGASVAVEDVPPSIGPRPTLDTEHDGFR